MEIKYRIFSVDKKFGAIQVNYYDEDLHPEGFTYQIDVPIDANGMILSGDELDSEIKSRAPAWMFERISAIQSADLSHLDALVVPNPYAVSAPAPVADKPQPITNATTV